MTTVHRENVWHPYYEINIEEEDLATIYRNAQKKTNDNATVDGVKVSQIEAKLENMDKAHRDEKDQMQAEKTGDAVPKKKVLNFAEVIAKKQAEEEEKKNKQVRDPKGIKLQGLSQDVVEKELY